MNIFDMVHSLWNTKETDGTTQAKMKINICQNLLAEMHKQEEGKSTAWKYHPNSIQI